MVEFARHFGGRPPGIEFPEDAGDCVIRAVTLAVPMHYLTASAALASFDGNHWRRRGSVSTNALRKLMTANRWREYPGDGRRLADAADLLPRRAVVLVNPADDTDPLGHCVAVIEGTAYDLTDPRSGRVQGWFAPVSTG